MAFSASFEDFQIPRHQVQVSTSRSSGPGGQNVNKVETKVELRFHLASAYWIPPEVKARMALRWATRISRDGEFIVVSGETRSQHQNLELGYEKLREMIGQCWRAPVRRIKTKATRGSKERRLTGKKITSEKKKNRGSWSKDD